MLLFSNSTGLRKAIWSLGLMGLSNYGSWNGVYEFRIYGLLV